MKIKFSAILCVVLCFLILVGCDGDADQDNTDPSVIVLEEDIVGVWAPIEDTSGALWQFRADGTFVDTELKSYEYVIQNVDGVNYLGFDREGLNISLAEENEQELERVVGQTDHILIYQIQMSSKDTLVLDPASTLYGSDSYFGFTFNTLILQRQ